MIRRRAIRLEIEALDERITPTIYDPLSPMPPNPALMGIYGYPVQDYYVPINPATVVPSGGEPTTIADITLAP